MIGLLLLTRDVSAQKPIGLFDPGMHPPAWASFGALPDWASPAQMADALTLSQNRGFKWVLQVGYMESPITPIGPHAVRVREKFAAAGLLPHLVAMNLGEEWYEHWQAGHFTALGLPPSSPAGADMIHDWLGRQHAAAKAALGLPVVWLTTVANNDRALVPYRPVPAGTDLVALDAYVHAGGTFAQHVAPILAHAERTTHLPLVLVPQWFRHPGDPLWDAGPSAADVAQYFAWFARPRWVALWGFTWRSRPWNGLIGLSDMPDIRAAVEAAVGGQ